MATSFWDTDDRNLFQNVFGDDESFISIAGMRLLPNDEENQSDEENEADKGFKFGFPKMKRDECDELSTYYLTNIPNYTNQHIIEDDQ